MLLRLAAVQLAHPWKVLGVAALVVALSLWLASGLEVRPGFEALLPQSRPSVQELERVKQHTRGVSSVSIVLEGDDTEALRKAADAVKERMTAIGPPMVGSVENGVHDAIEFLQPRAGMFLELDELQKLHDDVEERYEWEVGKATGATLELDDEDDYEPPAIDPESLKKRFGVEQSQTDRYPDGYFQSQDGKAVLVVVRTPVLGTDFDEGRRVVATVKQALDGMQLASFHPSIRYGLSGDLVTGIAEYVAINEDLTDVGLIGALLIIGVVFLYYLRMRTLLSMVVTISIGVAVSAGVTELLVGKLNMATGFLFTIIAGNGINPGIIYMARFLEARRAKKSLHEAIELAHRHTWLPTLTASCAAGAAYASLLATEFRGFRDFGIIGGLGMVICWICTYSFMPSVLVAAERIAPLDDSRGGMFGLLPKIAAGGTRFGVPFAKLVARAPRLVTAMGMLLTVGCGVATWRYMASDPLEYDLKNLRTDMSARAEEVRLTGIADTIGGQVGGDDMAILVDRPEQVEPLITKLRAIRDAAPADAKPFKDVHALEQFVPENQPKKIALVLSIKDLLLRARKRKFVDDDDWKKLEPLLPSEDLKPFAMKDLPEGIARPFTERDGTRGRIVYISPIDLVAVDDARYLFRWADAYRRTELDDGSVILGSGRAVIYADIWGSVLHDIPIAVMLSLLLTLVVVVVAFRAGFAATAVMAALLTGVLWMVGLLVWFDVRLNFLNFIALPITFGIGVDYAVNVMQRYRREGRGGVLTAVRETGGAVVLCSMTTTLGYLALTGSDNYAVRSLGIAAVLGEIACLLAAVIVLPGALTWRDSGHGHDQGSRELSDSAE
jgi:predicted RND superfamily exporter protein